MNIKTTINGAQSMRSALERQTLQLCTKKCFQKVDIKQNNEPSLPQRSCFHRCSIKLQESLRFTTDSLRFQSQEIAKVNAAAQGSQQLPLMEKLHAIYEQHYGRGQ